MFSCVTWTVGNGSGVGVCVGSATVEALFLPRLGFSNGIETSTVAWGSVASAVGVGAAFLVRVVFLGTATSPGAEFALRLGSFLVGITSELTGNYQVINE